MATTIRFLQNYYMVNGGGTSYVRYQAGMTYPADEETLRLAEAGIAEVVSVDDAPTVPPTAAQQDPAPASVPASVPESS